LFFKNVSGHPGCIVQDAQLPRGQNFLQQQVAIGAGLPDVVFSNQKSQSGLILEDLGMENVAIFIWNIFASIWYI
jgi:hypothetical protein